MKKVDDFFQEMRRLFLEKDLGEFEELKEDMTEHIQIKLSEGEEIDVILEQLGTPKTIVDAFYEDKRLEKVMTYDTDIVAIEDVKSAALQEEKDKLYKFYTRLKKGLKVILKAVFILLMLLSIVCLGWSWIAYEHLSIIFLLILGNSIFDLCLLKDLQHKSIKRMSFFTLIFVIMSFFIMYSIHFKLFFYQGEKIDEVIELDNQSLDSLTLMGDFPINLTIEQTSDKQAKMKVTGRVIKSAKKELEVLNTHSEKTTIDFGQKSLLSYFSALKELDVTLYVPKDVEKSLVLDFEDADVQSNELTVKNLEMTLESGEINLEDLESQHVRFSSEKADLFLNNFNTPIEINNVSGKNIIKNGRGNITITSRDGFNNIFNVHGDKANINNANGKLIMTETEIDQLAIDSNSNTIIVESQLGDTSINAKKGKLVLKENKGSLAIKNQSAPIIITQHYALNGQIDNQSGLIKWVQYSERKSQVPKFNIHSSSKDIRNDFSNQDTSSLEKEFVIKNSSGKIEIIKK